jgi:hypothetical protein
MTMMRRRMMRIRIRMDASTHKQLPNHNNDLVYSKRD